MKTRIRGFLQRGHSIKSAVAVCGISPRCYHDQCERDAAFLAATQRARAIGRMRLVDSILADRDWRSKAWYLERTAPDEFAHTEQSGDEAEEKKSAGCVIYYQTGNNTLAQLLDFPIHESMRGTEGFVPDSPEQIAAKQARLCGDAPEPAPPPAVSDAPEPESGLPAGYGPPPQAVPKYLSGRIDPSWKKNNGQS